MSISISGDGTFIGVSTNYSFDQSVSIAGTVTYEDVTNVDSIGVITARNAITVQGNPAEVRIQHTGNGSYSRLISDSNNQLNIYTGGGPNLAMVIDQNQNIGIGTDNPTHEVSIGGSIRVQNSSNADQFLAITHQGIDFGNNGLAGSATTSVTTSHLLDDYEEGTWTPIYTGRATTGTAINHRAPNAIYVKIGKQVTVQFDLDQTNTSASGNAQILGLPFPATTGPHKRYTGSIIFSNNSLTWSSSGSPLIYLNDGNNAIWIVQNRSGADYQFIDRTSNRFECWGVLTYFVD